jgi:hypothetical protein
MKKLSLVTLWLAATVASFGQTRVELICQMTGAGKVKAVWKTRDSTGQFQAELQVEGERLRPNTTYTVLLGSGQFRANVRTDSLGVFRLTRRYTTSTRPLIRIGTPGMLLLNVYQVAKGTFVRKT